MPYNRRFINPSGTGCRFHGISCRQINLTEACMGRLLLYLYTACAAIGLYETGVNVIIGMTHRQFDKEFT